MASWTSTTTDFGPDGTASGAFGSDGLTGDFSGDFSAGLAGAFSITVGGAGGGKATLAPAGGRDGTKLEEALAAAAAWVNEKLS